MELPSGTGKHGKSRKAVDWVALIDELWTSDDESIPNSRGEPSSEERASCTGSGVSEASISEHDVKELASHSPSKEKSLQGDHRQPDKKLKVVGDPMSLSEDPLTDEGDSSHSSPSSRSADEPSVLKPSHRIHKTRQTDLLSFIDRKYSHSHRAPLMDVENLTHSDSTDDGYMTSDNSRVDYTPQLSLSDIENETTHKRALFAQKSTRRNIRKRKASEVIRAAKRSKDHHSHSDIKKENEEQLYLDLGQKNFGHVTCKVCGMIYTTGQPTDQAEHLHFHKSFLSGVNFPGWKKEHVVGVFYDGRIIMVLPTDPKLHLRKVEEIRKLVDLELGYASGASMASRNYKVFLYISLRKRVMGCVIAEEITQGYQILGGSEEKEGSTCTTDSWLCSTSPQPAQLGINRLWVSAPCRKKGIASKLLDAARSNFVVSYIVPKSKVAFSDPTPDGRAFASRYCSTPNFLVYRWL